MVSVVSVNMELLANQEVFINLLHATPRASFSSCAYHSSVADSVLDAYITSFHSPVNCF